MRNVAALNAGSSSLKFATFHLDDDNRPIESSRGSVAGIGGKGRLSFAGREHDVEVPDHAAALAAILDLPDGPFASGDPVGIGHRVVHGGPDLAAPVQVDHAMLGRIEALTPLAPLHNPPAMAVLKAVLHRFPGVPQVACFDTAFHRGHPAVADRFAIPDTLYREGVRRYGFHGLSYEYIAGRLTAQAPEIAFGRVVVAHLGSGASMCALAGGRSIDSTMGFSALDGLPMGTRSGALDAGVVLWLLRAQRWPARRIERFLYEECGLRGLSGVSADMQVLLASEAPLARLAVDYFVYHVARSVGTLAAAMGGIEGLVFTGGIGEHSAEIRQRVLRRVAWLGFVPDEAANHAGAALLTTPGSRLPAYVVPTDEEVVIARHTAGLLGG